MTTAEVATSAVLSIMKLHTLSAIGRAVILTAAVAEILAVFPATFPMSYLIFPLPVGMSFFAYGLRRAVVTALGMTAVAALISSPPAALLLLAFSGPYGFFAGAFFRYGWSLKKLIVLTAAYIAVLMTLFFAALYVTMDINVFAAARQELDAVITRGLANVADTGISEIELMNTRRNVTAVLEVLPLIIPSAIIIAAAVIVYCTAKVLLCLPFCLSVFGKWASLWYTYMCWLRSCNTGGRREKYSFLTGPALIWIR